MKKFFTPILFAIMLPLSFSCSTLKGYTLNETDAAAAIRQMLQIGTRDGVYSFNKESIMSSLFPGELGKVLNTLQQLGLTSEIDRFTNTLSTAAEQTANKSIPIFVDGISRMNFSDAMRIIKNGGTSATDYLRSSTGAELRRSIAPIMQSALDEYKLVDQWNKIIKPVKGIAGNKFNLDLTNLMAGVVSEAMFRKIEEKEREIRANATARTTPLLQKVFSRNWNDVARQ
jgi:uncharacterized protein DUF4197